jgi:cellulose synthase/poly-beta-1,6-N-acetylglucosamine synthase-like glycosyltransferase
MLQAVSLIVQGLLLALIGYNAVTAVWGWRNRAPAPRGAHGRSLRVVIPAHDEEGVVGTLLADLEISNYPAEHVDSWVLADRCTDRTVELATGAGVAVAERTEGPPGKGAALAWYLERHPLASDESLVIFDADNRVGPGVLGRIADELDAGHVAVQCYLDAVNPDDSLLAEATALSYWAGNRMAQLARSNLCWSADLGGTGMALTSELLDRVGGFGDSLTEDQELGVRIVLAGERVEWLHDVKVHDEKPASVSVTMKQRARWMSGKRAARRRYLGDLLRSGSLAALDQALRLVQPSRTFVALLSGVLTVLSAITGAPWLLPWQVWGGATAVQVLEPIPFLARDGVPARRLVRYPLLVVLAALWIPIRMLSRKADDWYHTPHRGSTPAR